MNPLKLRDRPRALVLAHGLKNTVKRFGGVTHVSAPSSVTSMNSSSSSLVSSVKGSPLVSRAHASSPSGERKAPSGGERSAGPAPVADALGRGVQYLAKMCLRQASSCDLHMRAGSISDQRLHTKQSALARRKGWRQASRLTCSLMASSSSSKGTTSDEDKRASSSLFAISKCERGNRGLMRRIERKRNASRDATRGT